MVNLQQLKDVGGRHSRDAEQHSAYGVPRDALTSIVENIDGSVDYVDGDRWSFHSSKYEFDDE